jgi:uncharacterized protein (UPF0335 family)
MPKMPNNAKKATPDVGGGDNEMAIASAKLRSFIERIENEEEEISDRREGIKAICEEAKGAGLDVKTIRILVRWRKQDKAKRAAQAALLELYSGAIGELGVFG